MFGFGKGKIEIQIDKYNYSPGETINGVVHLKLNKPLKARGLNLNLVCERKSTEIRSSNVGTRIVKVFDFKQPLDGEKEYPSDQTLIYNFQVKIPPDAIGKIGGFMGGLAKAAQLISRSTSNFNWYLVASLDLPMKIDVSKKIQINIA